MSLTAALLALGFAVQASTASADFQIAALVSVSRP
jgi:hypothetical protein